MKLIAALLLSAGVALSTPIAVSGSGTFFTSFPGINGWQVSFSGTDGINSFSVSGYQGTFLSPLAGAIGSSASGFAPIGAYIDGRYFSPGLFSFSLGFESGNITGYDAQHNVVVRQDLISQLSVTSYSCTGSNPFTQDCQGTFSVHSPEPPAWSVMLLGVVMLVALLGIKRRRLAIR
jgi:hypothetical protein